MSIPKNHQNVLDFVKNATITNEGFLKLPTLWSLDKHGNYRYWIIFIGIMDKNEKIKKVDDEYINKKEISSGFSGVYWTQSGIENTSKPIISAKTYIDKGKNIGRKNYTTPFTQAILDAKSDYDYKIRKGNVLNKSDIMSGEITMDDLFEKQHRGDKPWRVFAMAVHDVNKNNNWKHVEYPCYLQPKLDGTMFIVVCHPKLPLMKLSDISVNIDSYSRGRENYEGQEHILLELYQVLNKYPGLHITGELWKKGYGLQDISGASRRQLDSKIKTDAIKLDFNVFDCFYIDQEQTFEERNAILNDIMSDLDDYFAKENNPDKDRYVKLIPSYIVKNKDELDIKYKLFLEENMEGGIIRNIDSLYEVGIDKEKRSYKTLKIKPRPDAEWPVINFKDGEGKEKGAIIWICAENDEGVKERTKKDDIIPLENRKTFSVTPNMPYELRYKIYEKCVNDKNFFEKIKGQLITINYSILSKDLLPQQPKMIMFRDPKIHQFVVNI